jgi:hypothetical protein
MYDSTNYGMESTTEALTYRPSQPTGATIPKLRIMASYSMTWGGHQLLYNAPRTSGNDDKDHDEDHVTQDG